MVGNQEVVLNPGQFLFGRKSASMDTGLGQQTIRTALKMLISNQQVLVKSTNKYSIITIINWDTYQPQEIETNQQITSKLTHKKPTNNQQITTDKNDKNVKELNTSPADAGLISKIDEVAEQLYRSQKFPKVHAFKNKMLKEVKNPRALLDTLVNFARIPHVKGDGAWAYCTKVMQIENGNYNEQDYCDRIEKQKRDLEEWISTQ